MSGQASAGQPAPGSSGRTGRTGVSSSTRRSVALLGLVVGLVVYALVVARVAGWVLPPYNWFAHLVYYAVLGVVWIWPAARLIRWSARGEGADGG